MINTGLIQRPIGTKDYLSGESSPIPNEILQPDGDWRPYKSDPHEMQLQFGRDYALCTKFAGTDTVESYLLRKLEKQFNFNERALAIMSGQEQGKGDSLFNTLETIRLKGLVPQELHPWTAKHNTVQKFYSKTEDEIRDWTEAGLKWVVENKFMWEWVWDDWGPGFREMLKSSPLFSATLYASESGKVDGIYTTELPNSPLTTHAVETMFVDEESYKWIDDSYSVQEKKLNHDFRIPIGARIYIEERNPMSLAEKYGLSNNQPIQLTEPGHPESGAVAIFLDDTKLIPRITAQDKIALTWLVRNHGKGLTKEAWDEIPTRYI